MAKASKKTTGKAAKPAPKKKETSQHLSADATIKILKKAEFKGTRGVLQSLFKNGQSVADYKSAVEKKGLKSAAAHLRFAAARGLVAIMNGAKAASPAPASQEK